MGQKILPGSGQNILTNFIFFRNTLLWQSQAFLQWHMYLFIKPLMGCVVNLYVLKLSLLGKTWDFLFVPWNQAGASAYRCSPIKPFRKERYFISESTLWWHGFWSEVIQDPTCRQTESRTAPPYATIPLEAKALHSRG